MNLAVGVLMTAALIAQDLPVAGSVVLGASFILVGLLFGGVALLMAQVSDSTRLVYGAAGALLGAAYLVRALGDIGDGTLSWFSPIGIAQKARPYADERWWPLLLLVAATAILFGAAAVLAFRRDLGAGLLASRPGPPAAAASLGHPLGLAFRLQRLSLLGWGAGVLVFGVAYGSIGPTIDAFIGQNQTLAELMAGTGGGSLTDLYFATAFQIMALIATGFAVQSTLRLRGEETAMRADLVLAGPVSRWRFGASHLVIACLGSVILLAVAGLATGLTYGLAGGNQEGVPGLLGAALVYAPAMWTLIGLAVALDGLAPRWVGASWAILLACLVAGFLGPVLGIPTWIQDLSPFERVPRLPAASLALPPLVALSVIAAALMLVGLAGLRRRDLGAV
jgi:ABC-2 type transport system permease protein